MGKGLGGLLGLAVGITVLNEVLHPHHHVVTRYKVRNKLKRKKRR